MFAYLYMYLDTTLIGRQGDIMVNALFSRSSGPESRSGQVLSETKGKGKGGGAITLQCTSVIWGRHVQPLSPNNGSLCLFVVALL